VVVVTHRFSSLAHLPPSTPVIANWHGGVRTEAFLSTVGDLKATAKAQGDKLAPTSGATPAR
jgi:hypothetical protein